MVRSLMMGFLVAFGVILLLGSVRGELDYVKFQNLKRNKSALKAAIDELEAENANFHDEIVKLKTSPKYARSVLRDKYHETDENERIVFFAD